MNGDNERSGIINLVIKSWDNTDDKRKLYYSYTIIFLVVFLIAFSPFILGDRSFICQFDGRETIFQGLIYTGKWVRGIIKSIIHGRLEIPLYDFSLGWGSRIFADRVDPVTFILAPLFTVSSSEILYSLLIVLRLYCAGLTFIYLCRYFHRDRIHIIAGCMVYLFSAYMIYGGLAFPDYITPMIQLPLLIVGADKILKKEKSFGFAFVVMYTALCGYYHLYIQTLLVLIFCIIRFFSLYSKGNRIKEFFGRLLAGAFRYILGIGMSAAFLLPSVLYYSSAGRSSFSNINISKNIFIHWNYFWIRLVSLISPIKNYEWDWGMDYPAYAAIFLFSAIIIFTSEKKKKTTQKWLLVIALFMLFCPWCGLVMNGFQYSCNRWSFGLSLLAGFLVVDTIPDLFSLTKRQYIICLLATIIYALIAMLPSIVRREVYASVGTSFLAITMILVVICNKSEVNKRLESGLCLCIICFNICTNVLYLTSSESMGWSNWFMKKGYETDRIDVAIESEPAYSPYGYEVSDGRIDSTHLFYQDSIVYSQPGTNIYTPLMNVNIVDFWNATEGSGNIQNFKIYSSDQRTILNTLLSVDQQYERDGSDQYVPYGYTYKGETFLENKVFQNDYSLGWGYTYDESVTYDLLKYYNGIDLQETMLQAAVLDRHKQLESKPLELENKRLSYSYTCNGCNWDNGTVAVEDGGGTILLNATLSPGKEYYIRVKGFNIDEYGEEFLTISTNASFDISVESGGVFKYSRAMSKSYPWYYGRENYLFCLGCLDKERDYVQFHIPVGGIFRLEDIELYELPFDKYPELVNRLRDEPLENVKIGVNELTGTVNLNKNKILCLTVPYEDGWTAYVDGKEAEILKVNYAFMGLDLTAGSHEVVFRYHVPYLDIAILISLTCVTFTLVAIFLQRKIYVKEKK